MEPPRHAATLMHILFAQAAKFESEPARGASSRVRGARRGRAKGGGRKWATRRWAPASLMVSYFLLALTKLMPL